MLRILLFSLVAAPSFSSSVVGAGAGSGPDTARSLKVVHANDRAAEASRVLASIADNQASFFFLPKNGLSHEVTGSRWRSFSPGERAAYVREMAHDAKNTVCYAGDPDSFARAYFAPELKISGLAGEVIATPSVDGQRLGLALDWQRRPAHFRVAACADVLSEAQMASAKKAPVVFPRATGERAIASAMPAATEANGFLSLKADYERAPEEVAFPWLKFRGESAVAEARFADSMRSYFADPGRFWCHVPWLGREAGMSDLADLLPAPKPTGATRGQVLYNSKACRTLGRVFGAPRTGIYNPPHWGAAKFEEGSFFAQLWYGEGPHPVQIDLYLHDENFHGPGEGPWVRASFRAADSLRKVASERGAGAPESRMPLLEIRREGATGMDRQIERARQNYETRYRGLNF